MTANVETVSPETSLEEVAQTLKKQDVGSLPVVQQNQIIGIVTDRDIVIRALTEGHEARLTRVSEIMSSPVFSCYADQDLSAAVKTMKEHQIRRLLVLNRDDTLAGIVSLADIALETRDARLCGEILEKVSEPGPVSEPLIGTEAA